MEYMKIVCPCHFGLESVLKREIYDLGYDIEKTEDGRVTFLGDAEAVCRANIGLRTAQRVLLSVGDFTAKTFDELFEGVRAIPWEDYLPENAKFPVTKASSINSRLYSTSDIQAITKKAAAERMRQHYHKTWFDEDGSEYPIRVFLNKDRVTVALDTSGTVLHKRGYRTLRSKAPITETLAAALILLTPWHGDRILIDPFCGSGTIVIEAALMAAHIAPGMFRSFAAGEWENLIPAALWKECYAEARAERIYDAETDIQGYDIDRDIIAAARENARRAKVEKLIHFQQRPVSELSHPKKYGFIITNPPYGQRLSEKEELPGIYRQMGEAFARLDTWSKYVISSYDGTEHCMGRKADKKRKVYNGMIRADYYQFLGPKPPGRSPHTPEHTG